MVKFFKQIAPGRSAVLFLALFALTGCMEAPRKETQMPKESSPDKSATPSGEREIATLAAGCFWCIEAVLQQVDGVLSLRSGYMGGTTENPSYDDICTGTTGHAEVVEVTFDPKVLPYEHLLAWFWQLHDPTTLNRQGNDRGTQYRSAIFFHTEQQERKAKSSLADKDRSGDFPSPIVTEITAASTFYVADQYHQDYYRRNKSQGYCRFVIAPKLQKLKLDD